MDTAVMWHISPPIILTSHLASQSMIVRHMIHSLRPTPPTPNQMGQLAHLGFGIIDVKGGPARTRKGTPPIPITRRRMMRLLANLGLGHIDAKGDPALIGKGTPLISIPWRILCWCA